MIAEETEKLEAIGYKILPVKEVKIVKAKSFYADAWREFGRIRVSSYYLEAPKDEIRATIMHELCHLVPEAGHGHGANWKRIASRVNANYPQYNIKRIGSNLRDGASWSLRGAASMVEGKSFIPVKQHMVQCTCCGTKWYRTRESNLTLHPERYKCHCGGTIVRVF